MISLTSKTFADLVNAGDDLSRTVRGHQAIENLLQEAISEALPEPHAVELSRLSFNLKVDLAVALRIIPADSRPAYVSLNRTRNRFAHKTDTKFEARDVQDFSNVLSPRYRYIIGGTRAKKPLEPTKFLAYVMLIMFFELEQATNKLQELKLEAEVTHEMVEEALSDASPSDEGVAKIHQEIKRRSQEKRKLRGR